jgi:hypothetical protein
MNSATKPRDPGSGIVIAELTSAPVVRSSKTNCPAELLRLTIDIPEAKNHRNLDVPVVPSVLPGAVEVPKRETLPSNASRKSGLSDVYQIPNASTGEEKVIEIVGSKASQITMPPERGGKAASE